MRRAIWCHLIARISGNCGGSVNGLAISRAKSHGRDMCGADVTWSGAGGEWLGPVLRPDVYFV